MMMLSKISQHFKKRNFSKNCSFQVLFLSNCRLGFSEKNMMLIFAKKKHILCNEAYSLSNSSFSHQIVAFGIVKIRLLFKKNQSILCCALWVG